MNEASRERPLSKLKVPCKGHKVMRVRVVLAGTSFEVECAQ